MKPLKTQAGYTLVELAIVIALSAIFLLLALQNLGPKRDFLAFQANVEKLKATIRSAQIQGQAGRGDDHNATGDTTDTNTSGIPGYGGQYGNILCGTEVTLSTTGTYQYYRLDAPQLRNTGAGTTDNPIADASGPLLPFVSIGGAQSLSQGTTISITQAGTTFLGNALHLYFTGAVTTQPFAQAYAYDNTRDPGLPALSPGCTDLAVDSTGLGTGQGKVTITVKSQKNHIANIIFDPTTGLLTSQYTQ